MTSKPNFKVTPRYLMVTVSETV